MALRRCSQLPPLAALRRPAVAVAATQQHPHARCATTPPPADAGASPPLTGDDESPFDAAEFSRLRGSLHSGSDSGAVYNAPPQSHGAGSGFEDPALVDARHTRLFLESIVDTDAALGGAHRSDYFRDPSAGYAPRHSPRNFAAGGAIDAYHALSPLNYSMAFEARNDGDHWIQGTAAASAGVRDALLRARAGLELHQPQQPLEDRGQGAAPAAARQDAVLAHGQRIFAAAHREAADTTAAAFFQSAASARLPRSVVGSWDSSSSAAAAAGGGGGGGAASARSLSWLDGAGLDDHTHDSVLAANRERELELFRVLHGERDRERYEETRQEKFQARNPGYDVDRIAQQQQGRLPAHRGLPNLVPPGPAARRRPSCGAAPSPPSTPRGRSSRRPTRRRRRRSSARR